MIKVTINPQHIGGNLLSTDSRFYSMLYPGRTQGRPKLTVVKRDDR